MMDHLTACTCDQCLLAAMRSPDGAVRQQGWEAWYLRDAPAVHAYVRRRCDGLRCAHHADDILQDCFLIGFRNVANGRYSEQGMPLCGYLFGIAKLLIVELDRRRSRQPARLADNVEAPAPLDPDDVIYGQEILGYVREACTSLSALQQRVLVGIYLLRHSSNEVAAELGKAAGNVRIIAHRAVNDVEHYVAHRHGVRLPPSAIRACLEQLPATSLERI